MNKDDYFYVDLYTVDRKPVHKRIHRLVADTFIGPNPDLVVNHIDGNKHNNDLNNIEWVTPKMNSRLASETGLYKTKPIKIIETEDIYRSVKECAEALKVHPSDISHFMSGQSNNVKGFHFEFVDSKNVESYKRSSYLRDYQLDAVNRMRDGCILNGGVGSGKSRTGLYYYFKEYGGSRIIDYTPMVNPPDLYIITTARKRDTLEWESEMIPLLLSPNPESNYYNNTIIIDSWNNIKKYKDVENAFFIFDEQKVVGSGAWVKAFLKITKANRWILLSATAGDTWSDYIPVFIANGFYKNRTEFNDRHVVWSRFSKYPKIDKYIDTGILLKHRNDILIDMDFKRPTIQHDEDVFVSYDICAYKDITKTRTNPYEQVKMPDGRLVNKPIENASEFCYLLRKIVNSDVSRQVAVLEILEKHPRAIIFYNFDYELDILKNIYYGDDVQIAEWNGHAHEPIPQCDRWVYLVQYTAGAEGWNCITTDTIIFYSQNYSYKVLVQSKGRIDRLNTPYKDLYYYHIRSRSGIDLAITRALNSKKKFNETGFYTRG